MSRTRLIAACLVLSSLPLVPAARAEGPFALRGVIEGFYGPPYSHADRLGMIDWIGDRGMNVYVYAPKNDPYQRELWRQPYPTEEMARFAELTRRRAAVAVAYSISPGESICYSAPSELDALVAKLEQFTAIGVRSFFLSFDDVAPVLTCPADLAAYEELGEAHADLVNRLLVRMPGIDLVLVPTEYSGTQATPYKESLRTRMDSRARAVWTGTAVVSPEISRAEADAYRALVGHGVVLWDNYPVNDWTFATGKPAVFMGPLRGRPADLPKAIDGIVANPMVFAELSKVAIATVAAYATDPARYQDPEVREGAWHQAILDLENRDVPIWYFAQATRAQPAWAEPYVPEYRDDAPFWASAADDVWSAWPTPWWDDAFQRLSVLASRGLRDAGIARGSRYFPNPVADQFRAAFQAGTTVLLTAQDALRSSRPSLSPSVEARGPGEVTIAGTAQASDPAAVRYWLPLAHYGYADYRRYPVRMLGDLVQRFVERTDDELGAYLATTASESPRLEHVTIGEAEVPVDAAGRFSATVPVPSGASTVDVMTTDTAGRTTAISVDVGAEL